MQNQYDQYVNQFSPEGRIYQVEYAINSSKLGASGLGIRLEDCVILVNEKRILSPLIENVSFEKILQIDKNIFCMVSGVIADSQELIETARIEASNHRFIFRESINLSAIARAVGDQALNFGEGDFTERRKPSARPYGVSLLFGGLENQKMALYEVDPSGTVVQYLAKGVGFAQESIQQQLEQNYNQGMSLDDGIQLGLVCIRQVMEQKITEKSVDVIVIGQSSYEKLAEDRLRDRISRLPPI